MLSPQCAYACSYAGSMDAERALAGSEAVFSGEVAEVEEGPTIRMWGISSVLGLLGVGKLLPLPAGLGVVAR